MKIATVGIDLAKNVSQVHGANEHGKAVLMNQLRRRPGGRILRQHAADASSAWKHAAAPTIGPASLEVWSHGAIDGATVRQALRQDKQERRR